MFCAFALALGRFCVMFLLFEQLSDLFGESQRLLGLLWLPLRQSSFIVGGAQNLERDLPITHLQTGRLDPLQCLEQNMVHASQVELPDNQSILVWLDLYAGFLKSLQHAYDILPVLACLALANHFPKRLPPICEPVPVEVFEIERDVAQSNFNGLSFELCLVLVAVDKLLLFLGEVGRQEDFGVEFVE